jgi:hypothetical protein
MAQFGRLGKPEVKCHIEDMADISRSASGPSPATGDTPAESGKPRPSPATGAAPPREIGGPKGPEPTRYGDWEVNGRCSDF